LPVFIPRSPLENFSSKTGAGVFSLHKILEPTKSNKKKEKRKKKKEEQRKELENQLLERRQEAAYL